VKEHIGVADSEVYLHHFWGHYVFIPLFFNRAFINWLMPKRWRLPAALLEELATSVRVMARLLWTVHLDYSQVGSCSKCTKFNKCAWDGSASL
jgi:hypothetical protein